MNTTLKVSVIIPVYNAEGYILRCLDSVYAQSSQDFEVIVINDGSTDRGLNLLQDYSENRKNMKVIDQANHGQGYARNIALEQSQGEFILFVDADDFIDERTLELTVQKAEAANADVVHFGWRLFDGPANSTDGTYHVIDRQPFRYIDVLQDENCDDLLKLENYFSVNNLYRAAFLKEKRIRYGEGFIYEDNVFMVQVATSARRIAFVHLPLYNAQHSPNSSTRGGTRTDRHYKDFLLAVKKCFDTIQPRKPETLFYLAAYFIEKCVVYYERRIPVRLRSVYVKKFVDTLADQPIVIPLNTQGYRFIKKCIEKDVFKRKKYAFFHALIIYKVYFLQHGLRALRLSRR